MSTGRVEVREYIHTITMYFDADGNYVGEEHGEDTRWNDTLENRPMTEEEEEEWLHA